MARKSWAEKLADPKPHEVKPSPNGFADIKAGQMMLLPTPRLLDGFIRTIPKGTSLTGRPLREALAVTEGAEIACPVVTGICLRIVAEAADEQLAAGVAPEEVTPVWRALAADAPTFKKLENGPARLLEQRRAEGL